jgi:hypothetical protein
MPDRPIEVIDARGINTTLLITQLGVDSVKTECKCIREMICKQVDVMKHFVDNLVEIREKVEAISNKGFKIPSMKLPVKPKHIENSHLRVIKSEDKDVKTLDKS